MRKASTLLIVFAKAPQAGRVKTRLARTVGAEGAARLHAALIGKTLRTAGKAHCEVELHGAPRSHRLLRAIARRHAVVLRWQREGDIGRRMQHALGDAMRRYGRVVLVGSDCPALAPADLRRAVRLLASHDAVIAPAEDGGYPLIGVSRAPHGLVRLFGDIEWSTASVLSRTRERLASLGWRWAELRKLWDVDRPEDLARWKAMRPLQRQS